jgi:hypothetical protein
MNSMGRFSSSLCKRLPLLVGGFKHGLFIVHFIYGLKNPEAIDELHHFSRWLKPPTSIYIYMDKL